MTSVAIWIAVALPVAAAMELWAAFLHGRVWHHALWRVHRSHHSRRAGRFESNDLLSSLHAPIAIALILYGCLGAPGVIRDIGFGAGIGMTLFGVAYLIVHDGLVHGRLPVARLAKIPFFERIRAAHLEHHTRGREPFGLFLGPRELARATEHGRAPSRARAPTGRAPRA
ncbi:MAG TPA: beta-carotene hydroxylase [Polyangiaceae bacterium]|jgi:beta-carotene 3-hydroxylase|nr:beta-carotene hydroxylase [Polyangiaceae bacterium]